MKIFVGKVISKKMKDTATVIVEIVKAHPVYSKRVKKSKKYQVHDEFGVKVGDVVRFVTTKPISKTKKWKIIKSSEKVNKKNGTTKNTTKTSR